MDALQLAIIFAALAAASLSGSFFVDFAKYRRVCEETRERQQLQRLQGDR